jgi:hypothetical protein
VTRVRVPPWKADEASVQGYTWDRVSLFLRKSNHMSASVSTNTVNVKVHTVSPGKEEARVEYKKTKQVVTVTFEEGRPPQVVVSE